jgi:hypothetical protein
MMRAMSVHAHRTRPAVAIDRSNLGTGRRSKRRLAVALGALLACGLSAAALSPTGTASAQTTPPAPSRPANQTQPGAPAGRPAAAGPVAKAGPIVADPQVVNFGVVEPGAKVSATIRIINPLDRPVLIKKAAPSCTCTTIDMTGKTIPARGFLEMPMSMKSSNSTGERKAKVNMVFEGLDQLLSIDLIAESAYMVRSNPPFIDALAPERMKGFFELVARDDQPFTVLTVDGKPAQTADGSPMKPAARHVVAYDFTQLEGRPVPPFLIVETDHPKSPLLDLRVRHESTRITPALPFGEFRSNLGVLPAGGSTEFEVHLKTTSPLTLTAVESLDPAFKVELLGQTSDADGALARVRFTDVSLPKGMFLRKCRFKTASKSEDFLLYGSMR